MSDEKNTGGPAFSTSDPNYETKYGGEGMSLRDYFAAKAMAALMREWGMWTPNVPPFKKTHIEQDGYAVCLSGMDKEDIDCLARYSYSFADAMLKAREQ